MAGATSRAHLGHEGGWPCDTAGAQSKLLESCLGVKVAAPHGWCNVSGTSGACVIIGLQKSTKILCKSKDKFDSTLQLPSRQKKTAVGIDVGTTCSCVDTTTGRVCGTNKAMDC